ncbi:MAG: O-antigen ligase family protein [Patescibacteria group bacterium]|nr:O-antigen ligase family protein [Patescibacteria group bacterium]
MDGFTKIPNLPPTVNLYLHDLIIILVLALYFLTKPKIKLNLLKPFIAFLLVCFISLFFAIRNFSLIQILTSSLYLLRFTVYGCLIFILKDKRFKLPIKKLLIFSSLVLAIFGIAQYLIYPDIHFLASNQWDNHYYRVIATFFDPSFVGMILLLGMILTFFTKSSPWLYPIYLIPLLLTYSRSTYLALLISLLSYTIFKRKLKFLIIGLLFILILPILPRPGGEGVKLERVFSIKQRLYNYQDSFVIIKQNPILGVGFNTLRYYKNQPLSHAGAGLDSSLLFVFATTGIIGFAAYLNLLKSIYKHSLLIKISLIALLTHSLFQNSLFYPWVLIWLFSLVASEKVRS